MRIHIYQVLVTGMHGQRAWAYVAPERIEIVGGRLGLGLHVVASLLTEPPLSTGSPWAPLAGLGTPLPAAEA